MKQIALIMLSSRFRQPKGTSSVRNHKAHATFNSGVAHSFTTTQFFDVLPRKPCYMGQISREGVCSTKRVINTCIKTLVSDFDLRNERVMFLCVWDMSQLSQCYNPGSVSYLSEPAHLSYIFQRKQLK